MVGEPLNLFPLGYLGVSHNLRKVSDPREPLLATSSVGVGDKKDLHLGDNNLPIFLLYIVSILSVLG